MRVVDEERRRMLAAASRDLGIEHLPPGVLQVRPPPPSPPPRSHQHNSTRSTRPSAHP